MANKKKASKSKAKAKKAAPKAASAPRSSTQASEQAYEDFVKVWNASASKDEVIKKTGLPESKVASWSYNLRAAGVPLKRFKTKPIMDVKKLTAIAKGALVEA
jgi:hypothetical protein